MERFVKGDIVVTPFPFSDLTSSIKRPALVIANLKGEDIILCQITTKQRQDQYIINLNKNDFETGDLKVDSFIRISRIFTLRKSLILYKIGRLNKNKIKEIEDKICKLIKNNFIP